MNCWIVDNSHCCASHQNLSSSAIMWTFGVLHLLKFSMQRNMKHRRENVINSQVNILHFWSIVHTNRIQFDQKMFIPWWKHSCHTRAHTRDFLFLQTAKFHCIMHVRGQKNNKNHKSDLSTKWFFFAVHSEIKREHLESALSSLHQENLFTSGKRHPKAILRETTFHIHLCGTDTSAHPRAPDSTTIVQAASKRHQRL